MCVCVRERARERARELEGARTVGEVKALVSEPDDREADQGPQERVWVRERERATERASEREKERARASERARGRESERATERDRESGCVCETER